VASNVNPTATITVTPANGFTGTVAFTASAVSNTSYLPGFSFSPSSVNITSTAAQTTTLTLTGITADLRAPGMPGKQVDAGTMLAQQRARHMPWYAAGSGIGVASLLLLALPRRRRLGGLLLIALAVAMIGGASGCGSGANTTIAATASDRYAGTYIVTVVGTYTSGSVSTSQTATVTFVIQ
jgi:hypothetical protein